MHQDYDRGDLVRWSQQRDEHSSAEEIPIKHNRQSRYNISIEI